MPAKPDYVEAFISKGLFLLAMVFERIDGSAISGLMYDVLSVCGVNVSTVNNLYLITDDQLARLHEYENTHRQKLIEYLDGRLRNEAELRQALKDQKKLAKSTFTRYLLGWFLVVFSLIYIFALTFFEIPTANQRFADAFGGILIGCVFQTVLAYFFNTDVSDNPHMKKIMNPQVQDESSSDESE